MARRIWIIKRKDKVEKSDIDAAKAHNCPEVVNGVPPALQSILSESDLPLAYKEPETLTPPLDFPAEIDSLKSRVEVLEKKSVDIVAYK